MTLPEVKSGLIRSLGEQISGNHEYIARVEREMYDDNPHLATVCSNSIDVLNDIFAHYGKNIDSELLTELLTASQTVARTTYLLAYQALKQQDICDELNDG